MENISHDSPADIVCELLGRFEGRLLMEKADDFGWIPLHYATYIGHTGRVYQLLDTDNRSLALTRTKHGMSALHISAERGHVDVIKLLIGKCPEICESLDEKDQTALHVAVKNKRKNVVKYFLQSLAFQDLVNEKDKNGNTALHLAASMINEGDIEILTILAHDSNIDKGAVNKAGMTFVDILFSNKQLKGFERLEIMSNWEREIYFPSYMKETREANQSTPGESKSNETQVEEKGGKVVDNNPTTEDIKKQKQQNYEQVNQPCKDFAPVSATSDLPSPEIMPKLQETSFGTLSSTALSDTATATANTGSSIFGFGDTATSTADNQTQGSTFLAASVPMLITQPSSAGIGISTFTQSMPLQFGSSTSSPSIGESKTDETQVEEKGGKVVDNNPTTEDIKMQKQQYYEQVNQTRKDFAPVSATSDLPSPEIMPEQETSFGTLSSRALSDTAAATATSTADNQTQGSTFLAASVSMPITQPSSAGTGISIFTESMPVQFGSSTSSPSFGLAGTTTLASGNSISVSTAAKLFTTGTTGLGSSATLSETNSIGSGSGTTPGLFGFSFGASTASSASANSLPAVFGSSTASAGAKNSVPTVFGSSNGSSASSVSSFTSPSTTALIPPVFGNPNSVCAFGSATSADNDQMNMKDSMAEDTVAAAGPSVPVFGQQPAPATTSGYVFGSVSPSVGDPFQFGSQQNLAAPQYTSPIQASGSLGFIADGSNFSRGSGGAGGGGDKNSRRIIKVKHNKMRKK